MLRKWMLRTRTRTLAVLAVFAACLSSLVAQQAQTTPTEDFVRSHYTKYEFRISMRDGNGSIRICDRGNVPICDKDAEQERVLLQSRLASNGDSERMYERLLTDINIMV